MFTKVIIAVFFILILLCLGSGMYCLLSNKKSKDAMAKALTWRIALSLILFILLIIGFCLGIIHPHGLS